MPSYKTLGFESYQAYLESDHWKAVKERFRGQRCLVCGSPSICLHHVTYERLGAELDSDLRPLCDDHHQAVHKRIGKRLSETDNAISALKQRIANPSPAKKKRPKKLRDFFHKCEVRSCNNNAGKHRRCKSCRRGIHMGAGPPRRANYDPFPGLGRPVRR